MVRIGGRFGSLDIDGDAAISIVSRRFSEGHSRRIVHCLRSVLLLLLPLFPALCALLAQLGDSINRAVAVAGGVGEAGGGGRGGGRGGRGGRVLRPRREVVGRRRARAVGLAPRRGWIDARDEAFVRDRLAVLPVFPQWARRLWRLVVCGVRRRPRVGLRRLGLFGLLARRDQEHACASADAAEAKDEAQLERDAPELVVDDGGAHHAAEREGAVVERHDLRVAVKHHRVVEKLDRPDGSDDDDDEANPEERRRDHVHHRVAVGRRSHRHLSAREIANLLCI
mmetsp:Transcript_27002/g.59339  ORF Transcript_27002/g.59339 Transcript_27002/m.59339 type:complete len:282 (+) Transcript_27002:261-1106(+)